MSSSIQTLAQVLPHAWAYCKPDQLVVKERNGYTAVSSAELYRRVAQLHLRLQELGLHRGEYCAVLSERRWELLVTEFAIATAGVVGVLLDPAMSCEQIRGALGASGAKCIFVSTPDQQEKLDEVAKRCSLENVIAFEVRGGVHGGCSLSFAELVAGSLLSGHQREEFHSAIEAARPPDLVSISCSSDAPDNGKGALLTQGDWMRSLQEKDLGIRREDVVLCFLPDNPQFARIVEYACMLRGATILYVGRTVESALSSLEGARPTLIAAGPEFLEQVRTHAVRKLVEGRNGFLRRAARAGARWGLVQSSDGDLDLSDPSAQAALRASVGGRVRGVLSSSGAVRPELSQFLEEIGLGSRDEFNINLGPRSRHG